MKVFITGATGTLGRPTVQRLVAAGHSVHALSRSDRNEALLRQLGAVPVSADLFDRNAIETALKGCEAVLHLASKIPPLKHAPRRAAWLENDRIRSEGTRLLVDAALAVGVQAFVYPSVCFFYPDRRAAWIDAVALTDPPPTDVPALLESTLTAEAQVDWFTKVGGRGVVLRMGAFYSPTAGSTLDTIAFARRGIALLVGKADAFWSQIWVDDAAEAVVAALLRAPAGRYDVVDDEPLPRGEIVSLMARAVGRRRLWAPPPMLLRLVGGEDALFAMRSQRVSNQRFKEATNWQPTVRNAREGWKRIMAHQSSN